MKRQFCLRSSTKVTEKGARLEFAKYSEFLNEEVIDSETLAGSLQKVQGRIGPESMAWLLSSSSKGQGLFSPVGQDRQWVHRPTPERVLLVKLGTKHLALC